MEVKGQSPHKLQLQQGGSNLATATKNTQTFAPSVRFDDDHKVVKAMKRVPKPNRLERIWTAQNTSE